MFARRLLRLLPAAHSNEDSMHCRKDAGVSASWHRPQPDRPGSSRCDQDKCACAQWNVSTRRLTLTHRKIRARHVLVRALILTAPTHDPGLQCPGSPVISRKMVGEVENVEA